MLIDSISFGNTDCKSDEQREEQRLASGFYRKVPIEELELVRTQCLNILNQLNIYIPELQNTFLQEGMTDESLCDQLMHLKMSFLLQEFENDYDSLAVEYCLCWLLSRSITRINCVETNVYLYTQIDFIRDMCDIDFSFFITGSDVVNGSDQQSVIIPINDIFTILDERESVCE